MTAVVARTKRYLEGSQKMKVEIEELESLLSPGVDVDFRRIIEEAMDNKGCAIFETFSSEDQSEFLVVSGTRWDKHQKRLNALWRQSSSSYTNRRNEYFPAS